MGFFTPKAQAPPPPPPAPQLASPSIIEAAASERQALRGAQAQGYEGTDVTGGQGTGTPSTTKAAAPAMAEMKPMKSNLGG